MKIPVEFAKKLTSISLPSDQWEPVGMEITFRRKGLLEEHAIVVWDPMNHIFYVKTNRSIIYPEDLKAVEEAITLMNKANAIVRPTPKTEKETCGVMPNGTCFYSNCPVAQGPKTQCPLRG